MKRRLSVVAFGSRFAMRNSLRPQPPEVLWGPRVSTFTQVLPPSPEASMTNASLVVEPRLFENQRE